ncbi:hypothetical protein U9M48_001405 [Paspalum notatum var. saurae]|uniref:F-box domain-containing protein n=1 Tax=Paspalum notatum var. saurae TaxID=547442 RepID=A0AAQ3SIX8_PASNO
MAAGGGTGTCLDDLSDDLLRHILFFTPAEEAASTSVLSRRWRSLWRRSGAINLDSRSFADSEKAFHAGAVRRLTIFVADKSGVRLNDRNLIAAVVSHKRARRVEELHVDLRVSAVQGSPRAALRLVNCCPLTAAPAPAPPRASSSFPLLADLHLERCTVSLADLQRTIDAAPELTRLHLGGCSFKDKERDTLRLRCPKVTDLVFADCSFFHDNAVELDAPMLRHLKHHGAVQSADRLSLSPGPPQDLVEVDVHLIYGRNEGDNACKPFWKFIQNFSTIKVLKLRLDFPMGRLALVDKDKEEEGSSSQQGELLMGTSPFCLLERLELEAGYDPKKKQASMVMLGNLLSYLEAQLDFNKSVDGFRRRRKRRRVSSDGQDEDVYDDQAFDIPGLSEHSFPCLQSCLRRVSLHFRTKKANCLGVQLAKFFAEKAMVLEEMYIDDGTKKLCDTAITLCKELNDPANWTNSQCDTHLRTSNDLAIRSNSLILFLRRKHLRRNSSILHLDFEPIPDEI